MLVFTEPSRHGDPPARGSPSTRAERVDLDRIAERRAGAVRLDVADVARRDAGVARAPRGCTASCAAAVGRGQAVAAAVLVDGRAADHREHADRRRRAASDSRFSTTDAAALAAHEAVGARVERPCSGRRRPACACARPPSSTCGVEDEVHAAGERRSGTRRCAGSGRRGGRRPATTSRRCRPRGSGPCRSEQVRRGGRRATLCAVPVPV